MGQSTSTSCLSGDAECATACACASGVGKGTSFVSVAGALGSRGVLQGSSPRALASNAFPVHFPMYLMSWDVLVSLDQMMSHQEMQRSRLLTTYESWMQGQVVFISHEWLGYTHPDPAGEQLAALRSMLRRLVSGTTEPVRADWQECAIGRNEVITGGEWTELLPMCYFWLDFASMPQRSTLGGATLAFGQLPGYNYAMEGQAVQMMMAVRSIPAYIERSSIFLVLVPVCQHKDNPDRVCNFASWRGRGWCRMEQFAVLFSRSRPRMLRCTGPEATPVLFSIADAMKLRPGEGEFSCCEQDHWVDGRPVPCDKLKICRVMEEVLQRAAVRYKGDGDLARYRMLLCARQLILRGLDLEGRSLASELESATQAEPETVDCLSAFKERLCWTDADDAEVARKCGQSWSLLHWAAFAGNVGAVQGLLDKGASALIDVPAPVGFLDFGIEPGDQPLHLAACAADGTIFAAMLLLEAGANPMARSNGEGFNVLRRATSAGTCTLQQLQWWLKRFPGWDCEEPDATLGFTVLAGAAFCLPRAAPVAAELLQFGADARTGDRCVAVTDAALLLASLKEDSDPEVVSLLLEARCSPHAEMRPPWQTWPFARNSAAVALGSTPLHGAAARGDVAVMRVLLEAKANPFRRNSKGDSALDCAARAFGGQVPGPLRELLGGGFAAGSEVVDELAVACV